MLPALPALQSRSRRPASTLEGFLTHRTEPLMIELTQRGTCPVIAVTGGVDPETAPLFAAALSAAVATFPSVVEIDLTRSTRLDQQGMAIISAARNRLAGRGATLTIVGGQEAIVAGCEALLSESA